MKKILDDANYIDDKFVVQDKNLITRRGPATVFEFAYKLVDVLGGDSATLKKAMLYDRLLAGK